MPAMRTCSAEAQRGDSRFFGTLTEKQRAVHNNNHRSTRHGQLSD
jgi:hypothetical protein